MLTNLSLNSPYCKIIFRRMKEKGTARVEKFSTNINLLVFDFYDFMEELCTLGEELLARNKRKTKKRK